MEKFINKKKYNLPKEVVAYIEDLEYYHNYEINKRVIEIHYGLTGHILFMFKDFFSIPKEIFPANDEYFDSLGEIVQENHKKLQWFIIKKDNSDNLYAFPFVFLRIMPPLGTFEDTDEDVSGEMISDN